MDPQVKNDHYSNFSYDSKERFVSYWHQIDSIIKLKPDSILEVGVGNKFVSTYLKERGYKVTTFDFAIDLKPDFCGSVLNMPFKDESYDLIACCQVLEHIPFDHLAVALNELRRVTKSHIVVSLPDVSRVFPVLFKLPKLPIIKALIPFPKISKSHDFDGEHYWEIGKRGYPLSAILDKMKKTNLKVVRTFRIFEFPYHRFFILGK